MLHGINKKDQTDSTSSNCVKRPLAEIAFKDTTEARELCSTEFSRTRLIRHRGSLRVCGNKLCFASHATQIEKGKPVLQASLINYSASPTYSLNPTPKPLIPIRAISDISPWKNLQHSFALCSPHLSYHFATLICVGEAFSQCRNQQLFPITRRVLFESRFESKLLFASLRLVRLSAQPSTPNLDIRRPS